MVLCFMFSCNKAVVGRNMSNYGRQPATAYLIRLLCDTYYERQQPPAYRCISPLSDVAVVGRYMLNYDRQ